MTNKVTSIDAKRERKLDSIEDIVADIKAGKMVIMMDDEDRENEGDLIMAAEKVRPEDVNFMVREGRGLVCLPLTQAHCRQLGLKPMVDRNTSPHHTNFTVSIEAASGVTTGISAYDRAHTVRTAVRADARPEDLRQPGHIFPIMAQPGGVLTRAGHTEAGCDLARLAGFEPAAMIVEIMNEDGTMARRPELERFAHEHKLKIGTITDLIRHRLHTEHSVERIAEQSVQTEHGPFRLYCYEDHVNRDVHLALVHGEPGGLEPAVVRVHLTDTLRDVIGVRANSRPWTLQAALARVARASSGVVVILRHSESPRELLDAVRGLARTEVRPESADGRGTAVLRTYGIGAQILHDLGVRRMRVLSAPRQLHGIAAFGLEIVDYIDENG